MLERRMRLLPKRWVRPLVPATAPKALAMALLTLLVLISSGYYQFRGLAGYEVAVARVRRGYPFHYVTHVTTEVVRDPAIDPERGWWWPSHVPHQPVDGIDWKANKRSRALDGLIVIASSIGIVAASMWAGTRFR